MIIPPGWAQTARLVKLARKRNIRKAAKLGKGACPGLERVKIK